MNKKILDIALRKCRHYSGRRWGAYLTASEAISLMTIGFSFSEYDRFSILRYLKKGYCRNCHYSFHVNGRLLELLKSMNNQDTKEM